MISEVPDIQETGRYSASEAIRLLGVGRTKFYADLRCGRVAGRPRRDNGRLQFTGRELLRYWKG